MQQATSLQTLNLPIAISGNFTLRKSKFCPKKSDRRSVFASKRDPSDRDGKLVDENMIVLRLRIQEMKKKEEEAEEVQNHVTKSNKWMEWDRKWWKNYEADVLGGLGLLQILLMNSRPSLALGVVAILIFSLSTSLAVTLCHLLNFVLD